MQAPSMFCKGQITTRFTKALDCLHPIVLAPMGGVAGERLARAVSDFGGLGFIGTGGQFLNPHSRYIPIGDVATKYEAAKKKANEPKNVGIGLIVKGFLDKDPVAMEQLLMLQPPYLNLSPGPGGYEGDFTKYIKMVTDSYFRPKKLFVTVSYVEEAEQAALAGADVIILKGRTAGGYRPEPGKPDGLPLIELVYETKLRFTLGRVSSEMDEAPLIVAAGGILNGTSFYNALDAGADAVCLGTALAASCESELPWEEKTLLLRKRARHLQLGSRHNPDGTEVEYGRDIRNDVRNQSISRWGWVRPARELLQFLMEEATEIGASRKACTLPQALHAVY